MLYQLSGFYFFSPPILIIFLSLQDKQGIPWWLGISYKGIGQYDLQDKVKPRKVSGCVFNRQMWDNKTNCQQLLLLFIEIIGSRGITSV